MPTSTIDIKLLDIIPIVKNKINELTAEKFTLYPFPEEGKLLEIPPEFKKYNINPREAYDVLDDFDKTPDKLTDNQKVLRKKYLNIVLALMDNMSGEAKKNITKMIDNDNMNAAQREDLRTYVLGNYDPAFTTIKRIINLLIKELDSNTACNKTPFIIAISILSVFLVIMIIAFIVSRL